MSEPNWDAIEREEEDVRERCERGEITQNEMDDELDEIRYSVMAEHDEARQAALDEVDRSWGF